MAELAEPKELSECSPEEVDSKVMMEGSGEQVEGGEDAVPGPGDDGELGEGATKGLGEEGEKSEGVAAVSMPEKDGEKDAGAEKAEEDRPKGLIGYLLDTDFVESLPVKVKYRVLALKKLQTRAANLESKFLREFHDIERKFAEMYQPLLEKRRQIVNAIYEPTEEECKYKLEPEDEEEKEDEMDDNEDMPYHEEAMVQEFVNEEEDYEDYYYDYAIEEEEEEEEEEEAGGAAASGGDKNKEDPKGIPDFWLTVLKNVEALTPLIKKYDEPILKLLTDIKVKLSDPGEPLSFTLEFHFKPNEYFKNELLTKTYVLKSRLDCYDPHPYRGTAIECSTGCEIDWNEGKNVTMKTITKKQKHRIWGTIRTVTEDFPKDSFFNFFSPRGINLKGGNRNEDFLLGHNLRTYIIPRSVLFFSGDALESQQEGVVREVNDAIYDKIIYDNWMAAIEEVKTCCKNLEALVEDIDR
ncbi:nucleosome assembly protein 1-like 2 [Perognathus longimembris pacificus]|uniref:nucleosome assembly protein 1-like 2 n=1 Tax=Perognathus longimembris pacificus TaxID=214514 RepID=UPI00201951F9|nr:nucleosome assembly protein 1-like 2 [Perognathus longimembris pacificus]